MNNQEKLTMMKDEKISSALLKLGIPTMVGMIVSALYSVVDAYFVGGLGDSQMGAISVVFPIVQLVVGLGMTFGCGAGSYISRLLGKGDKDGANRTASTALYTAIVVGIIAILISMLFLDSFLRGLGSTENMLPFAREYAMIYIPGAIFNIFNVCMNNIVIAEGRARLNLIAMLMGCGLNVILDPIFIYPLGLGVAGAAIATVVAQVATTVMYLVFILSKKGTLRFSIKSFSFDKNIFQSVLSVGIPVFMFQLVSSISMSLTNAAAKPYGDSAIAATGTVVRIMTLGTYVVFGFMKGFQPLVGYNYGAKQFDRVKHAIRLSLIWSTIFCTITAVVFMVFPSQIVSLFSKEGGQMVEIGASALRANACIFPLFGFQMVYMALFLAIGKAKQGGILSIGRQGLFFIPLILLLPRALGIDGIIWTQPVADAITIILTLSFAICENRQLNMKIAAQKA